MDISPNKQSAVSLAELWSIQESLLQSYRAIFITVESVVLALAIFAAATTTDIGYIKFLPVVLGLALTRIWTEVCNARALAVTFVQWMIQRHEGGDSIQQPYTCFREFQLDRTFDNKNVLEDKIFKKLRNRDTRKSTRKRMDEQVPGVFVICWISLALFLIFAPMNASDSSAPTASQPTSSP